MAGRGLDFWRKPGTVLRGPGSQDSAEERVADLSGDSVSPWFPVSPLQSPWPPESLPLLSWASISVTQPRQPTSSCGACPAREGVEWAGKGGVTGTCSWRWCSVTVCWVWKPALALGASPTLLLPPSPAPRQTGSQRGDAGLTFSPSVFSHPLQHPNTTVLRLYSATCWGADGPRVHE